VNSEKLPFEHISSSNMYDTFFATTDVRQTYFSNLKCENTSEDSNEILMPQCYYIRKTEKFYWLHLHCK
jgi:hypothetical protein